jgi:hypothetical protein
MRAQGQRIMLIPRIRIICEIRWRQFLNKCFCTEPLASRLRLI